MADDRYTTLHRKDERGVIVESGVFGPDDEVPEGFEAAEYTPIYDVREDTQAPVDESNVKPWDSPVKVSWVEQPEPEEVEEILSETDEDDDESEDEVPPQGGPGSGRDVWAAYAASKDVEIEDGATRDEIIAACEAAGVPVA